MTTPLTPNLDLYLPTPDDYNSTPSWGQLLNDNFQTLDAAVPSVDTPLTPERFRINADLDFNSWNATHLTGAEFQDQSDVLGSLLSIYFKDGEFYVNDNSGNEVQITEGGSVNAAAGNISGLPSSPAGAGIAWDNSAGEFVFTGAGGNVRPTLATGPLKIYDVAAGPPANAVTLASPAALATSYMLKLPSGLPPIGKTGFLISSSAGVGDFAYNSNAATLSPYTGWNAVDPMKAVLDAVGVVHLQGSAYADPAKTLVLVTTGGIPASMRPTTSRAFVVPNLDGSGGTLLLNVSTNGSLLFTPSSPGTGAVVELSGISYIAGV